ncbi:hypothetical protein MCNS_21780 [Mycobacterium conspicuum]|uniref:Uncharacterized protein n=1 Tax=Mycobacterium conspicuum TaxID=44010 RepID=A0A1X1TDH9_9MYCO|nr:hypothetical protein AWC00_11400 [Mycobacterium conspicuum]BBZ39115.1 hypothetical protein MCNS_21780 [Mycobacterium conspicuum]
MPFWPFCWFTCAALPVTDAISPLTRAAPLDGGGAEVVVGAAVDEAALWDVVGLEVFDDPHAASDSAVTAVAVRIANRASRGAGVTVSPIVGGPNERVYRKKLCGRCAFRTRIRTAA